MLKIAYLVSTFNLLKLRCSQIIDMNPSLDIFAVLYFAGLALAIFWVLVLLGIKRGNQTSNRILAVLLFMISIGIVNAILVHTKYIFKIPHLIGLSWPISFAYPPLFFLYVKSLTSRKINFKKQLFHFTPFIISAVNLIPFYLQSGGYKTDYLLSSWNRPSTIHTVVSSLIIFQELIYITLSLRLLLRHSRKVNSVYSTLEKHNLSWIRSLIVCYVLVTAIYFVLNFYESPINSIHVAPVIVVVFVYALGYMGVRQPGVFSEIESSRSGKKYLRSGLDSEKASNYLRQLIHIVETDRLFVDSNLTLHKLANKLSISPNHLSQLLNESLNQSFSDFVNYYRVEEAKKLLRNPANNHLTILAISYEVGFNSKSSFNSIFKKHVDMTPSQYMLTTSKKN